MEDPEDKKLEIVEAVKQHKEIPPEESEGIGRVERKIDDAVADIKTIKQKIFEEKEEPRPTPKEPEPIPQNIDPVPEPVPEPEPEKSTWDPFG
ncbi:MAG: hypothetical protein KAV87_51590 [Desulfobacteraceae bacterium]|nr:hypothetical protein [Desulfobacteraceae bacterium]